MDAKETNTGFIKTQSEYSGRNTRPEKSKMQMIDAVVYKPLCFGFYFQWDKKAVEKPWAEEWRDLP